MPEMHNARKPSLDQIPSGVKVIASVTAIRWFGWGFGESLIPVYLYSFLRNYTTTGIIGSAYELVFIVSLPLVGIAADRISSRVLIALGLALYPLVGLCYFLGGYANNALLFVILAQAINGTAYAFDQVGRDTYIRVHSPKGTIATGLGYLDTVGDFWWVVAALLSIPLLHYVGIPILLLMIAPTSLVALLVISSIKIRERAITDREGLAVLADRTAISKALVSWNFRLFGLAIFSFSVGAATTISTFLIPIDAYARGASLVQVVLIGIMFTIPQILGWSLGKYFGKAGTQSFPICLIVFAVLLEMLSLSIGHVLMLVAALGIGVILEFFALGSGQLLTSFSKPEEIGRAGSIMTALTELGSLVGPIAMGMLMDAKGPSAAFSFLSFLVSGAGVALVLAQRYWGGKDAGTTACPLKGAVYANRNTPEKCRKMKG